MVKRNIKGISLIESLVAIVIVGIGFISVMQISAYSLNSMDRSMEKNKFNFYSEMMIEDMIGDPDNASNYGGFYETCSYSASGNTYSNYYNSNSKKLYDKKKSIWSQRLNEKENIRVNNKNKQPTCSSGDSKETFVSKSGDKTLGRVNFLSGQGKRKKFLGAVIK